MIALHEIEKTYRTDHVETTALKNINIKVDKGEFVSIMGPSGCGKSTLLNIIGLLDIPDAGSVQLNEEPVNSYQDVDLSELRNRHIGFIFQSFHLISDLSAIDNVELPLIYRKLPANERKNKARAALERVGLGSRTQHYPSQLSGGQRQRVAIARAIAGSPGLLLADEPTGNLDSHMGAEVMDLLLQLNAEGATIVMVTHDPDHAAQTGRIIRLADGQLIN